MINPEVDNIIFDSILTQALKDYSKECLSNLPSESELSTKLTFSDEFLIKMDRILAKNKKQQIMKKTTIYFKKSVVTILIIAGILFGAVMLSHPVRATIQNVIIEWFEKYTRFEFKSEKGEVEIIDYRLGYIPEDFVQQEKFEFDGIAIIDYINSEGHRIIFEYSPTRDEYSINLDNENSDYKFIDLNDFEVYLFESKLEGERNYLLWDNNGYTFKLISELNVDEMIKVAENIENN